MPSSTGCSSSPLLGSDGAWLAGRYGRVGYGAAVFYVFTTVVHTGLLGAILTLSSVPLYPTYVTAARLHGFDALVDQQLAGLLM